MNNQTTVLQTNSLTKFFGETKATDNISLDVKEGEIYGFLGLNGAGKTTLIRMLLGMIKPDNGKIMLFGKKLDSGFNLWNDVGYLVETPYAYPNLTVTQNLKIYYKLRGLENESLVDSIIEKLKLTKYKEKKAKELSLGNQQRLGLAKALMHGPKLLILDEPINGLDPEGIVEVRELLKALANEGSTIFLSSHILGEISKLANRICIIHEGRIVKELATDELTRQLTKKLIVKTTDNSAALNVLTDVNYIAELNLKEEIEIMSADAIANPEVISQLLVEKKLPPRQIYLFIEDLEMYFLRTIRTKEL
ncbi:ABC transporter ATP-binding protein [Emticicia sp. BO119]|uniref:ABC transporter ATP-binding protein n=1 Tax=Emticicia sp. BO119 TaxID=2757768 RepID=UPI0015F0C69C|nr:ATP-binding cassette domain-containing protein [Emticicia sp. BO119]MBA4851983.1 ATP-binding cassette domain-containing protein [Emticicia sp. BO119]